MTTIGLDIGGANLKAADGAGWAAQLPFRLWESPQQLPAALKQLVDEHTCDLLAVTMTGELVDAYPSKPVGVREILDAVADAFTTPAVVWQTSGEFVAPNVAAEHWQLTAAANWHALATWSGRAAPDGDALLIDIGSTTTDIIPLTNGYPVPFGRTDPARLASWELVYTGVRRTPLCHLRSSVSLCSSPASERLGERAEADGSSTSVVRTAAEFFATADDVWLVLGERAEQADSSDTADGRPRTVHCAQQRIARMICADADELGAERVEMIARQFADRQIDVVAEAIGEVIERSFDADPATIVLSGEGRFLARKAIAQCKRAAQVQQVSLADALSPDETQAACAFAVARLADERIDLDFAAGPTGSSGSTPSHS